jgi:hypothetical protein
LIEIPNEIVISFEKATLIGCLMKLLGEGVFHLVYAGELINAILTTS